MRARHLERMNIMDKTYALKRAFTSGFLSFSLGAAINLLCIPFIGKLTTANIVSIIICAIISIVGGIAVYRIWMPKEKNQDEEIID